MGTNITPKHIILCVGITEAILISYFLADVSGWKFEKSKNAPFENFSSNINWYRTKQANYCAIWSVGGCDFTKAVEIIIGREKIEHSIENIVIVTDNDDVGAVTQRFSDIEDVIKRELGLSSLSNLSQAGCDITVTDGFQNKNIISLQYLLVPENKSGALETFILDALSEQDEGKKDVIRKVEDFVNNFESDRYLRERREKTKAKLGVSLAIFSPDKIFTTMDEFLRSTKWGKFETTNTQFQILKDLK